MYYLNFDIILHIVYKLLIIGISTTILNFVAETLLLFNIKCIQFKYADTMYNKNNIHVKPNKLTLKNPPI